jgi:carbamoylphosphate synthase large subunit
LAEIDRMSTMEPVGSDTHRHPLHATTRDLERKEAELQTLRLTATQSLEAQVLGHSNVQFQIHNNSLELIKRCLN